jgi:hypothetical protein
MKEARSSETQITIQKLHNINHNPQDSTSNRRENVKQDWTDVLFGVH